MRFEWNEHKARVNLAKHGVPFEEAVTAFADPLSVTVSDPDHSVAEDRFLLLGATTIGRLVVVSHTCREDVVRIISARIASRRERKDYGNF